MVCFAASCQRILAQKAQTAEKESSANGVQEIPQLFYHAAVSDYKNGTQTLVQAAGLE
jgi:hypothetical protein